MNGDELLAELREEVTCIAHAQVFVQPVALQCLHTLCRKYADELLEQSADGSLLCPICEKSCNADDIQPDFRMEKTIERYLKMTAQNGASKMKYVCDFCNTRKSEEKCQDCDKLYCGVCTTGHQRIHPDHITTNLKRLKTKIKAELEEVVTKCETTDNKIRHSLQEWKNYDEHLKTENKNIMTALDKSQIQAIDIVKSVHADLRKDALQLLSKEQGIVNEFVGILEKKNETLGDGLNLIRGVMQGDDEEDVLFDDSRIAEIKDQTTSAEESVSKFIPSPPNTYLNIHFQSRLARHNLGDLLKVTEETIAVTSLKTEMEANGTKPNEVIGEGFGTQSAGDDYENLCAPVEDLNQNPDHPSQNKVIDGPSALDLGDCDETWDKSADNYGASKVHQKYRKSSVEHPNKDTVNATHIKIYAGTPVRRMINLDSTTTPDEEGLSRYRSAQAYLKVSSQKEKKAREVRQLPPSNFQQLAAAACASRDRKSPSQVTSAQKLRKRGNLLHFLQQPLAKTEFTGELCSAGKRMLKIAFINGSLWAVLDDHSINVISTDGVCKKSLRVYELYSDANKEQKSVFSINTITQVENGNILGCGWNKTDNEKNWELREEFLFHISESGQVLAKSAGKYDYVSGWGENIYALTSVTSQKPTQEIVVLHFSENNFIKIREIELEPTERQDPYKRIKAHPQFVCVSRHGDRGKMKGLIHKYDPDGCNTTNHGSGVSKNHSYRKPGQLTNPSVGEIDEYGNILVSDNGHLLQVLDSEDRWHILDIDGGVPDAVECLLSVDNDIYVLSRTKQSRGTIYKVTLQERLSCMKQ